MSNQAESWSQAPGWYDSGGGWMAYWDGSRWTGDQVRRAVMPPPPVAQRRPGRGLPWWAWIAIIIVVVFIGLPVLGAFMEGFSTGLAGR